MSDKREYVRSVRLPARSEADLTEIAMQTADLRAERIAELETEIRAIWQALGPTLEDTLFDDIVESWPDFLRAAPAEHIAQANEGARRSAKRQAETVRRAVHSALEDRRAHRS